MRSLARGRGATRKLIQLAPVFLFSEHHTRVIKDFGMPPLPPSSGSGFFVACTRHYTTLVYRRRGQTRAKIFYQAKASPGLRKMNGCPPPPSQPGQSHEVSGGGNRGQRCDHTVGCAWLILVYPPRGSEVVRHPLMPKLSLSLSPTLDPTHGHISITRWKEEGPPPHSIVYHGTEGGREDFRSRAREKAGILLLPPPSMLRLLFLQTMTNYE